MHEHYDLYEEQNVAICCVVCDITVVTIKM